MLRLMAPFHFATLLCFHSCRFLEFRHVSERHMLMRQPLFLRYCFISLAASPHTIFAAFRFAAARHASRR